MRKLFLAPLVLACLLGPAIAQQAPTSTADQGKPGTAPWLVSWTGQSVLADLRVAGASVSAANPVPVSGTVTLGAGTAQIGTINNMAFGITGSLPAFASTPTFNVGTTGGLALDATIAARFGTLGQKVSAGSAPVVLASDQPAIPVTVGNFPPTQPVSLAAVPSHPVTNAGTFAVQNTAPVVGGNTVSAKTDGSAVTQPVSVVGSSTSAAPTTTQLTASTGGVELLPAGRADIFVSFQNTSADTIAYVGPSGITTTTGYPIQPKTTLTFNLRIAQGRWVAITGSGTAVIAVLRY